MNKLLVLIMQLLLITGPVAAMQIEADPRTIISFMDKSLPPELDILRVTTDISPENHLIFQVHTKAERLSDGDGDYMVLSIQHEKTYVLLMPLNRKPDEEISIYAGELRPGIPISTIKFKESEISRIHTDFSARYIDRGVEFTVPLNWINFGADFGFDAYTVRANKQANILQIITIYDQARKGRIEEEPISAITLLNTICSPKK